ncbi:ubiquitin-protein ligase, putative [Entamoeba nuttalli P19]|uniref:HECT-type E3 ubiquitin transferase n=1 Tax=Entamoeba nuttalli (strain P19) TaxID=1076696 RepID=K2GTU0_ENTNP|nr:ubiquitin-protein ligase, putative [Entamoeba nuttalli P19]EKE38463.1 ubiquitin-protein ligase, putative [Entamoeba nuttalli P19]|eukprot:XP_008859204.1 ubiquitin-protein ligase, putative [Entamoeba nuttalli P19]
MDNITHSIKEGCGNPMCNNAYCKSNPEHSSISENEMGDFVVLTAINEYKECCKFITPKQIYSMTPNDVFQLPIEAYLNDNSLKASFRDFPDNCSSRPKGFEYINHQSIFLFMNFLFNVSNPETIKKVFNSISLVQPEQRVLFLCVPYQTKYHNYYGALFKLITENPINKEVIHQFLCQMSPEHLRQVHFLVHSFLDEMFKQGSVQRSNKYPFMIYALRLFKILYEMNIANEFIDYKSFYVYSINIKREWSDDFDLFFKNKEGLLSYSFIIELYTRVLVVHEENRCEQQLTLSGAIQNNFFELFSPYLELRIDRDNLLLSSLNSLVNKRPIDLKKELKIKFIGEVGVDQGGVSKEWFSLIVKELFKVDFGMFTYNNKTRQFWFCSFADDLQDFKLIGIVLGLAIYNNIILDISFPSILYKKLLDIPLTFDDYNILDPEVYNSLMQLKEMSKVDDVSSLQLTFEAVQNYFDENRSYELIPGGRDIIVTNQNLQLYLDRYADFYCTSSVQKQFDAFKQGFRQVVSSPLLLSMRPEELELVICGTKEYDFDALERNAKYKDYTPNSPQIKYFWEIAKSLTLEQKKKLLIFVTSNDRVPVGGLGNLIFFIDRYGDPEKFPTASTCFNALHLPPYENKEIMKEKLLFAIENAVGFGLA